jgi:hypothetical protein
MGVAVREVDMASQLRTLVQRIKQGMCILFIGPGLLRTEDGMPLNNAFALSLAAELKEEGIEYDKSQEKNMAYMIQHYIQAINEKNKNCALKIVDLRSKFKEFVKNTVPDLHLYKKLARIPFRLVLNANYDDQFYHLFDRSFPDKKVQFDYYDFSNQFTLPEKVKLMPPSSGNFIVYNLFGLSDEDSSNSLILTEKEFVRFVCRIHQPNTNLPLEITNHIDQNKYCLFLGFDFDQWYFKVVIRALWHGSQADSDKERENPDTLVLSLPPYPTCFFYESAFKFYFCNYAIDELLDNILTQLYPAQRLLTVPSGLQIREHEPKIPKEPVNIFFVSAIKSKEDHSFRNQISNQLNYLKDKGYAARWCEDMAIGDNKIDRLTDMIQQADIVIALVSIDFLNENKFELINRLLNENNKLNLIKRVVLLRPCIERFQNEFNGFKWLPETQDNRKPTEALSEFSTARQEKSISVIADKIIHDVYEIINNGHI